MLIFGAGPMGCMMAQAAFHAGATRVVITDSMPWRLDLASRLGITETVLADDRQDKQIKALAPTGFDIVADATGIPSVLEQSFAYVRPRGKVWVFGVCPPESRVSFVPYEVFRRDLTIIGSFAVNRTFHESIALIQCGAVKVEELVSHCLPLADFPKALELAEHDPQRMKVQFEIGS